MLILADAIRSIALQENSSLSVNLNKFLDLFLQSSGFGRRTLRVFCYETFTYTVLIGFYLSANLLIGFDGQPSDPISESLDVP
jgi:hypothetical protein